MLFLIIQNMATKFMFLSLQWKVLLLQFALYIFSGPIVLPEGGNTLVSAFYGIKMPVLLEPVTIEIEHCVDVSGQLIAEKLCFATATFDVSNKRFVLTPVAIGSFLPGETYGSIAQQENCFLCTLYTGSL